MDGSLRTFGFYRDGEPVGFLFTADENAEVFTIERVRKIVSTPSERENDGSTFRDSAEQWIRRIYREADAGGVLCCFCEKDRSEVAKLIAGPEGYICDECVRLCMRILDDESEEPAT